MSFNKRDGDDESNGMSEGSFQIGFTRDGETRLITLEGRREDYEFKYEDGELEIEARDGDFEWEFEDVESFEFLSFGSEKDAVYADGMSEGSFQISFTRAGETRVITLEGRREDYEFEYEDGELEIEAREGEFEWEFEDVDSFAFLSLGSEEDPVYPDGNTPEPGQITTLSGPLHDFDFKQKT